MNLLRSENHTEKAQLESFIKNALTEDVGNGDHTANACVPEMAIGKAKMLMKEDGVLSGVGVTVEIFKYIDPDLKFELFKKDGDRIRKGDVVLTLSGKARSILMGERLALNCAQRMSGIATLTRRVTDLIKDLPCKILDTRKTTPNLRFLEKQAVLHGGGTNHRFGLYDMMMIKDNHIDYAGGIQAAIEKANAYKIAKKLDIKLEIEARDLGELTEIMRCGEIDRIMLDNFSFEDLKTAVARIGDRFETEASGGITIVNVREYAMCGVNYISMGALTHSAGSLDISLKAF